MGVSLCIFGDFVLFALQKYIRLKKTGSHIVVQTVKNKKTYSLEFFIQKSMDFLE